MVFSSCIFSIIPIEHAISQCSIQIHVKLEVRNIWVSLQYLIKKLERQQRTIFCSSDTDREGVVYYTTIYLCCCQDGQCECSLLPKGIFAFLSKMLLLIENVTFENLQLRWPERTPPRDSERYYGPLGPDLWLVHTNQWQCIYFMSCK